MRSHLKYQQQPNKMSKYMKQFFNHLKIFWTQIDSVTVCSTFSPSPIANPSVAAHAHCTYPLETRSQTSPQPSARGWCWCYRGERRTRTRGPRQSPSVEASREAPAPTCPCRARILWTRVMPVIERHGARETECPRIETGGQLERWTSALVVLYNL